VHLVGFITKKIRCLNLTVVRTVVLVTEMHRHGVL